MTTRKKTTHLRSNIGSTFAAAAFAVTASAADPVIFADFEGADYGAWKAEGSAFGDGPAQGALAGQMAVEGFAGKGLVNSFHDGDKTTGRLTSPAFNIERKFITFLIGGGGYAGETCMNLLVGGKVVRTATGPNTDSGGSERLAPAAWDVGELAGKDATIEIVDSATGGWGHINVDQIAFADDRGNIPIAAVPKPPPVELTRMVKIYADFLQIPQMKRNGKTGPGVQKFTIEGDGKVLRAVHLLLAPKDAKADTMYSYDVREFRGREVTFRYRSDDPTALERLELSDKEHIDLNAYDGPHRPRFHFSPRIGWMNDVNGSYYADGLYHVFYQANPFTAASSTGFDMHWGHSVSKDMVHWTEWPLALFPDATGQCYSGTAVMARTAIPGVNDDAKLPRPVLLVAATSPFSQHMATTADGGRTWQRYPGNPVIKNMGDGDRDPKVFWHEASQHYCMVLFVGGPNTYRILRSKDLATWEQTSVLPGWYECPEFIPMKSPTTGEDLYLLYGSYTAPKDAPQQFSERSAYQLGRFDGKTFTPVGPARNAHNGPNFYAALVFENEPKARPIMMGWTAGCSFPGEPFNQCASVPLHLTLRAINGADTLCFEPAEELSALRGTPLVNVANASAAVANTKLATLAKDAPLDVTVKFRPSGKDNVTFAMRSHQFTYQPADGKVVLAKNGKPERAAIIHPDGTVSARFLIDRGIIESFWNGGEAAFCAGSLHTDDGPSFSIGGNPQIEEMTVFPMKDIWK